MPLSQPQATQIAQLLGQYQDVAHFVVLAGEHPNETATQILGRMNVGNPLAGAFFGMTALSFVFTYDGVLKAQNYPAQIVNLVDLGRLNNPNPNAQGAPGRPNETPQEACLRHLRNCFAHGRYVIDPQTLQITLDDYNAAGNQTFHAQCDAAIVGELAERVLIEAHNIAAAIALGPAPVPPGPAPGPAGALAAAVPPVPAQVAVAPAAPQAVLAPPVGNRGGGGGGKTPPP